MSETKLIGYVRQALDILERGEDVDLAALCESDPDLAPAVAEALGLRTGLGELKDIADSRDPFEGRVLDDRYELADCLGRGAMGVVYRAIDRELERSVAVKLFHAGPGRTPEDERRFVREALVLASVENDHVVRVFDRGTTEGGELYVVMECLNGLPMSSVLQACSEALPEDTVPEFGEWSEALFERPPPATYLRTVVEWIADVAAGLTAAHAAGVFHRDVKPSNIFVRDDLSAVLLDFGIARRSSDAALTATNTSIGTPWYMAPEQVAGDDVSPATDVYGLCATLYHMLALRPPFGGTAAQVFAAIQTYDPKPIAQLRPDLPRDLIAIVENGMERNLSRRYSSMDALERDLRAFLDHRPVSVRPLGALGRLARRARRRPARAIATASTVLLVPILTVLVWYDAAERQRKHDARRLEILASLPYDLAVADSPTERLKHPEELRLTSLRKLDELLELDSSDFASRAYRAATLLDCGRHDDAASDARALAEQQPSGYMSMLANVFANSSRDIAGHAALHLELPDPSTAHDQFIAGFLELRGRTSGYTGRALDWLTEAGTTLWFARDLRLVAIAAHGEATRDATLWEPLFEAAREVIATLGTMTSRTLTAQGISMISRGEYIQAIDVLRDANDLCPDQYPVVNNLGQCHFRKNLLDQAEAHFTHAAELRPDFWRSHYQLAMLQLRRDDPDAARAAARSMPTLPSVAWRRQLTLGVIEHHAAMLLDPADERRVAFATRAIEHFDRAIEQRLELDPSSRNQVIEWRRRIAEATATGDWTRAAEAMLRLAAQRPSDLDDPSHVAFLANAIKRTDWENRHTVAAFLHGMAIVLGGDGDPAFLREQTQARNEALQKD